MKCGRQSECQCARGIVLAVSQETREKVGIHSHCLYANRARICVMVDLHLRLRFQSHSPIYCFYSFLLLDRVWVKCIQNRTYLALALADDTAAATAQNPFNSGKTIIKTNYHYKAIQSLSLCGCSPCLPC